MDSEVMTRLWIIMIAMGVIQLTMLFAQVKLFEISDTLQAILKELRASNQPQKEQIAATPVPRSPHPEPGPKRPQDMSLHEAVEAGELARVKELIAKGATLTHPNKFGKTPLVIALERGHKEIVQALRDAGVRE